MFLVREWIFTCVFSRRLERKDRKLWQMLLSLFGFALLSFVIERVTNTDASEVGIRVDPWMTVISTVIFCSVCMTVMVVWVRTFFNVSIEEAVYAVILGYLAEHAEYALAILFGPVLPGLPDPIPVLLDWGCVVLFALLIDRIFARRIVQERHYVAIPRNVIMLLIVSDLVVLLFSAFATEFGYKQIHGIYAFVFCIFALVTQTERQKALYEQRTLEIRERLLVTQNAQYESYKENVELVNRKCHDLKHQVAAIRQMENEQSRSEALSGIEEAVLIYDSFIHTGCEMLDTLLTQKNHLCMERGILFTCMADGELLNAMDPVDLYTLFGNMLDNAIEASSAVPEAQRSISLSVTRKNGAVVITEENPYAALRREDGRFKTTKEDTASHGYGLASMEMVVEKYDGAMNVSAQDGIFRLSVAMPVMG